MHHPDVSLFGLHANTIACFIYSSIINKPWHPLWTYFFLSVWLPRFIFLKILWSNHFSVKPEMCFTRGSEGKLFVSVLANTSPESSQSKPLSAEKGKTPSLTLAFFCFSLSFLWPPLSNQRRSFMCHFLYSKTNLLHLSYNPPSVTDGISVSLEDGYGGACPVTHAINFSSKVKPCWCCY